MTRIFQQNVLALSSEVGDQKLQGDISHISSNDKHFVMKKKNNPVSPPLNKAIEFLTIIYRSGVGYSYVATARSDLSSLLNSTNVPTLRAKRYMKGILNLKLSHRNKCQFGIQI